MWFALTPWFILLLKTRSIREAFFHALWLSFWMGVGIYPWVAYAIHEFGQLPWAISILGWLIYSVFCQPQLYLFAPLFVWLRTRSNSSFFRSPIAFAFLLALLYAGLDGWVFKLFTDTLGHVFYRSPWIRQSADLGGAHLLTFVVVVVQLSLALFIHEWKEKQKRSIQILAPAALLLLATLIYGQQRYSYFHQMESDPQTPQIPFAMIQANIGNFEKVAAERGVTRAADDVLYKYLTLSTRSIRLGLEAEARGEKNQVPQFVVWPETAYASAFGSPDSRNEYARDQAIRNFTRKQETPLIFGSYDTQGGEDFNSVYFLDARTINPPQVYHKSILLPFGEYIPGFKNAPWVKRLFPTMGNFGEGPGPTLYPMKLSERTLQFLPLICYEALFPEFTIEGARKEADVILNVTNDSWFGSYGEPQLHLALSTFRSIETRVPQIRATNTGISAVVLPSGDLRAESGIFVEKAIRTEFPLFRSPPTLMVTTGDLFRWAALWASLLICLGLFWKSRSSSSNK